MTDNQQQNRGSEWREWDFQIQPIKHEWFCNLDNKSAELKSATRDYLKKTVEEKNIGCGNYRSHLKRVHISFLGSL